jgi:tetratricopeptide (TPR) repeat protein
MYRHVIELDPGYAIAHALLARLYSEMDQPDLAAESARASWRLRNRASESERFFIVTGYITLVTGDYNRAQEAIENWVRSDPRDPIAHGFLSSYVYVPTGQFERALVQSRLSEELKPDLGMAYSLTAANLAYMGRLKNAEAVLKTARERGLDIEEYLMQAHDVAFVKDDRAGLEAIVMLARGRSIAENWISAKEARALAWRGRVREARSVSDRAVQQGTHAGQRERAGLWEAGAAVREAMFGNAAEAVQHALGAIELSTNREVEYAAALAFAYAGESAKAEALITDMEWYFPEDTYVRFVYVPVVRARLALSRGDVARALQFLQLSVPLELGVPRSTVHALFGALYPVYYRGLAYLSAQRGLDAATEFRKIIERPGIVVADPVGVLARLQLARALAIAGDTKRARGAYRDFFSIWKDADPDIPILQQARAEYADLQRR